MTGPSLPLRVPAGLLALICCGVVLAGIVIEECRSPVPRPPAQPDIIRGLPIAQGAARDGAGQQEDLLSAILQQPLFVPSRRPAGNGTTAMPGMRLSGIVIGPGGSRTAIFSLPRAAVPSGAMHGPRSPMAAGGRGILAREGDVIGSWRIRRIGPGAVGVEGSNGMTELRPDRERGGGRRAPPGSQQGGDASAGPDDAMTIPDARTPVPPPPPARSHP
ncbi:hypothetical protein NO263_17520 [Gluconacetobacter entanii]|uniref:Uncharacterized protein n=1 Tax=Gluconacetobacter entanii TaxID=108528 RepID=A0ABT3KAH1_9PROT|nr:hypothetical protein [Gluconacetobacter entanii]MCW4592389.1 hypothetical protein [Gluconacetobacter entanii]MCW4595601.1 hypothetical protein [Gluconacetobacter entanii]NPC87602.1 hypothetical protein [Gluconacetobacter entanii]